MGVRETNYDRAGQTAYDAYCREVGGKAFNGDPLPTWQEQIERSPHIAEAWRVAAAAVLTVFGGKGD
jgi:hypothetical protein